MGRRPGRANREPETGYAFFDDGVYRIYCSPIRRNGYWAVEAWFKGDRQTTRVRTTYSGTTAWVDAEHGAALLRNDWLQGLIEAPDPSPATLAALVERFASRAVAATGRVLSPKTGRAYRTQLQCLWHAIRPDQPPTHLAKRHVENAVFRPGLSPKTAAQYLRAIRAMVRWAVAKGWMPVDVTHGVRVDSGPTVVKPYMEPHEIPPFLEACGPATRIRAGLIIETGMRLGEAIALRWGWVVQGIGRPSIRIPARDGDWLSKGRQVRAIPLSEAAKAWLEQARELWPDGDHVLHADGVSQPGNWTRESKLACEAAGVTPVGAHGLRRTAGVRWLYAGVDIYQVSQWLGHSSVLVTERHYAGIALASSAAAMDRVDAVAQLPRIGKVKDG